ncbi:hypothetical protein CCR75_006117 [Bremia lactucae]|uniref:Uncharacterized protein n=1 Tax=Bremia lactucae TaxID=4779 RepID=A0A976IJN5_BRELC|nr:hypothetical protein CCR75_006117 [Bremia lactucae]
MIKRDAAMPLHDVVVLVKHSYIDIQPPNKPEHKNYSVSLGSERPTGEVPSTLRYRGGDHEKG